MTPIHLLLGRISFFAFNTVYNYRGNSLENQRFNFTLVFMLYFSNKWLLVKGQQFEN